MYFDLRILRLQRISQVQDPYKSPWTSQRDAH